MISLNPPHRMASLDDAAAMAELVNMAGEGMPLQLWTKMAAADESPWEIGRSRAQRPSGAFSYRHTIIREEAGAVAACLIGYPLADEPQVLNHAELPAMFVPLQELEDLAPGTWYINVLATYPQYRGKTYATQLLLLAEKMALACNKNGLSIIVADSNAGARRLYERSGYTEHATRPMVKEGLNSPGTDWVLLLKSIS